MKELFLRTKRLLGSVRVRKNAKRPITRWTWVPLNIGIEIKNGYLDQDCIEFAKEHCKEYGVTLDVGELYRWVNTHREEWEDCVQPILSIIISRFGVEIEGRMHFGGKRAEFPFKTSYEQVSFMNENEAARVMNDVREAGLSYSQYNQMLFDCREEMKEMAALGYTDGCIMAFLPCKDDPMREKAPYFLYNASGWKTLTQLAERKRIDEKHRKMYGSKRNSTIA